MTFLLIIIVTLILILASFITKVRHFLLLLFSLLVFHYKVSSFFTAFILSSILSLQKFCHFLLLLFSRVELKANSKKNIMTKSSLYGFAVLGNTDAALSDEGFSWA